METIILGFLAVLVALVAIDARPRHDERPTSRPRDPTLISTQKITVDRSNRG
jgi:hypothetical protein